MIWGTFRRSVAPAVINANGFERLSTFSYSSLGGRMSAAVPSMIENGTDGTFSNFLKKSADVAEVNGCISQSKAEKGSAALVVRNMDAINLTEMGKVINTLAGKANDGSVTIDKVPGGSFTKFNSGVYGSLFGTPIFNWHQSAILGMHSDKIGLSLGKKGLAMRNYSTDKPTNTPNSLRPLSPHLPVYKPQVNAMVSIFNRFAAAFLTAEILLGYLLLQIGSTSFTYYSFYQLFFYSSKLTLLSVEITALAFAYHLFYGVRALIRPFRW